MLYLDRGASALRGRTHDVVGQIEYDSILPFSYLGNKDRTVRDRENRPARLLTSIARHTIV